MSEHEPERRGRTKVASSSAARDPLGRGVAWVEGLAVTPIRQVGMLTFGRALAAALQAASYVLVARAAPPAELGVVLGGLAAATVVLALLDLGASSYSIRELGARRLDGDAVAELIALRCVTALGGGLIWVLCVGSVDPRLAWVGAYISAESAMSFVLALALGSMRVGVACGMLVLSRGVTLVATILVVESATGLPAALASGSIAGAILGAVAMRHVARGRSRWPGLSAAVVKRTHPFMTSGALAQAANFDTAVVALAAGGRAAGFYGLPSRLVTPLVLVAQSYANVVLPHASMARARGDVERLRGLRREIVALSLASAVPLAALIVVAGPAVQALFGQEYRAAIGPTRVVLVAVAFAIPNVPLAAMLQALGRERSVARVMAVCIPAGLVAVGLGARASGPTLAALALASMQVTIGILLWRTLHHAMAEFARPSPDNGR